MKSFYKSRNAAKALTASALLFALAPFGPLGNLVAQQIPAKTQTLSLGTLKKKTKRTILQSEIQKPSASSPVTAKGGLKVRQSQSKGEFYLALTAEFTSAAARRAVFPDTKTSRIPGLGVLTVVDRFADVFVGTDQAINSLTASPGLVWVERSGSVETPPPPRAQSSPLPSRAVPEPIIRGGVGNLKGKNSIVAIIDTGLDFRHPDFIKYDAAGQPTSRLLYLWDPTHEYRPGIGMEAPFKYPNGASIGTVYTRDQLTAELRAGRRSIPATDRNGHGTACASVAAGNGNADFMSASGFKRKETIGVAPEADIIGIGMGPDLSHSYILNAAAEWLDKVAGDRPLVVSGSFGSHGWGHDGQTIEERQLDFRFSPNRPGRTIVLAAGNEGTAPIHSAVNIGPRESSKWMVWNAVVDKAPLSIYFSDSNVSDIGVELPDGSAYRLPEDALVLNPFSNQISLKFPVPQGVAAMRLFTTSGRRVAANAYFSDESIGFFGPESASYSGLVGSPGTMRNSITVGSYDWNDSFHMEGRPVTLPGACRKEDGSFFTMEISNISCYSSPGPTRDGRTKPETASPGQWYPSSAAKIDGSPVEGLLVDSTGNYMAMNGTSAATPYTAGVIALMFEKKPTLTTAEIKNLFRLNASKDPFTGNPPTNYYGGGKLDAAAVNRILGSL